MEGGRWKVRVFALHIRDDVDFDAERGEGAREFEGVVAHPTLHGGEFASEEADSHLQNFYERVRVVSKAGGL